MMMTDTTTIGMNIDCEDKEEIPINVCNGAECVDGCGDVFSSITTATTTSTVCFSAQSTDEHFVDQLATGKNDSIIHRHNNDVRDGFVTNKVRSGSDDGGIPLLSPVIDSKVDKLERKDKSKSQRKKTKGDSDGKGKRKPKVDKSTNDYTFDANISISNTSERDITVLEDIIEGFAFASFTTYDDLEEWERREEKKLRQLLRQNDNEDAGEQGKTSTSDVTLETTPKRKRKKNKDKMATSLAMPLKETNCLHAGNTSNAAVSSSLFQSEATIAATSIVGMPGIDSVLQQHSPQTVSTSTDNEKVSLLLRPKSSSGAESSLCAGPSAGNSITSARVKRPAINNNNGAGGDQATDLTLPAKVPKRETVVTVPGTDGERQSHRSAPLLSPENRNNFSAINDASVAMKNGGIASLITGTVATQILQHGQIINDYNKKLDAVSCPNLSGNSITTAVASAISREFMEKAQSSTPKTPSIATFTPETKTNEMPNVSTNSHVDQSQRSEFSRTTGKTVPNAVGTAPPDPGTTLPNLGAGLLSVTTASTGIGGSLPTYFHTEMHQHQHTHMHQYPPFLPFLGSAGAGLPGLTGMVGLPPGFPNLPGFPLAPQVPGLAVLPPNQAANPSAAQLAPKKRGKWCAMHVQIAWDIYNKTAQRRERKADETSHGGTHVTSANLSVASTSSVTSNNFNHSPSAPGQQGTSSTPSHTSASMDKAKAFIPDAAKDQKRKEKEKQRAGSSQRPIELDIQTKPIQNGVQAVPGGNKEITKFDQRYMNGTVSMAPPISSIIPPSPSVMLPLKMEQTPSSLFQDGLLSRQQHVNLHQSNSNSILAVQLPISTSSSSTSAAMAAADGLFRNAAAAAAMGIRPTLPTMSSAPGNFHTTSAYNNVTSNLALAAAVSDRLRPITPSSATRTVPTPLDAYRTLMGLDGIAGGHGRVMGYDPALLRPPLMLDPALVEREREFLRLQQNNILGSNSGSHQDYLSAASANPLASMIDLERAMNRPVGLGSSTTSGAINEQSIGSTGQLSAAQSSAALAATLPPFNSQLFAGFDTAAAAAAAAAALYSNGFLQRERMDLDQQLRFLGGVGSAPTAPTGAMDPLRFGFLGPGNPLFDTILSARTGLTNPSIPGLPANLGFNFALGGPSTALASSQLSLASSNLAGSLVNNAAMVSPFSSSLEQLARQKRDALLASAAAAIGSVPTANLFQKR